MEGTQRKPARSAASRALGSAVRSCKKGRSSRKQSGAKYGALAAAEEDTGEEPADNGGHVLCEAC